MKYLVWLNVHWAKIFWIFRTKWFPARYGGRYGVKTWQKMFSHRVQRFLCWVPYLATPFFLKLQFLHSENQLSSWQCYVMTFALFYYHWSIWIVLIDYDQLIILMDQEVLTASSRLTSLKSMDYAKKHNIS